MRDLTKYEFKVKTLNDRNEIIFDVYYEDELIATDINESERAKILSENTQQLLNE